MAEPYGLSAGPAHNTLLVTFRCRNVAELNSDVDFSLPLDTHVLVEWFVSFGLACICVALNSDAKTIQ